MDLDPDLDPNPDPGSAPGFLLRTWMRTWGNEPGNLGIILSLGTGEIITWGKCHPATTWEYVQPGMTCPTWKTGTWAKKQILRFSTHVDDLGTKPPAF